MSLPVGTQDDEAKGGVQDEVLHAGPIPRVSMDYIYLSTDGPNHKVRGQWMSTKELQRQLRSMGKFDNGSRQDLVRRYDKEMSRECEEEKREKATEKL